MGQSKSKYVSANSDDILTDYLQCSVDRVYMYQLSFYASKERTISGKSKCKITAVNIFFSLPGIKQKGGCPSSLWFLVPISLGLTKQEREREREREREQADQPPSPMMFKATRDRHNHDVNSPVNLLVNNA